MEQSKVRERIVLLSGAVGAGKSSVAANLLSAFGFRKISTSQYLKELAGSRGLQDRREVLQKIGDDLDLQTDFQWPIEIARSQIAADFSRQGHWLLDAVRKDRQVAHFRAAFPSVLHVHLTANEQVLRLRFAARKTAGDARDAAGDYETLIRHPNEIASRALRELADVVFDTGAMSADEIAVSIVKHMEERFDGAGSSD